MIVDVAQAAGVVEIDLAVTPVDFVAGTAAKWLMGPAGVGYLHVADRYLGATPPTTGWLAAANVADWDEHVMVDCTTMRCGSKAASPTSSGSLARRRLRFP